MKNFFFILISLFTFLFLSCKSTDSKSEQLKLFAADKQWSAAIANGDIEQVVSFWADDAVLYFPEAPIVIGRESIKDIVRKNRSISGFSLEHKPAEVFVSNSDDLGYTTGTFNISLPDKNGKLIKRQGNYVCIWNKQNDGSWKCTVNIGNYRSPMTRTLE
jgi:ketosteroid isomerase-like protein